MAEAVGLARIAMALGLLFVFIGLIIPGADSPWSVMVGQLEAEEFPQFNDPFPAETLLRFSFGLANPGPGYESTDFGYAKGTNHACSQSAFWNCVSDGDGPDQNETYYDMNDVLVLNTTGWPTSGKVRSAVLTIECHSNTTLPLQMSALLNSWLPSDGGLGIGYLESSGENVYCQSGTTYHEAVMHMGVILGADPTDLSENPIPPNLMLEILASGSRDVHISTVRFFALVVETTGCTGGDFFSNLGCSVGEFFEFLTNAILYLVNGIAFAGQVLFYVLRVLAIIVGGFLSIIAFLFAIPGAPLAVQAIIDVAVIGMVVLVLITFMKLLPQVSPV